VWKKETHLALDTFPPPIGALHSGVVHIWPAAPFSKVRPQLTGRVPKFHPIPRGRHGLGPRSKAAIGVGMRRQIGEQFQCPCPWNDIAGIEVMHIGSGTLRGGNVLSVVRSLLLAQMLETNLEPNV
jgi:hypothetical protein